ncbi:MAG: acyltransferase family protein [Deltaproteobacteria bacterium]|nr:acyltransferase family protein [Deltaproteobacteria bacterium]
MRAPSSTRRGTYALGYNSGMGFGDTLKTRLKDWTFRQGGADLVEKLGKLAPAANEYGVDPFGFNLDYTLAAISPLLWLYRNYFRVECKGIERVPQGRVLLVSNHSGQLPMDGAMIGVSMLVEADPPRAIRAMVEKWVPTLPYVSTFMARCGQIVGTPENCRRLLAADEAIVVFPEGVRGLNKLWSQRYQLQDFGLGFMRLALETDTPIVPVAVVGAEEQAMALMDLKPVAKIFGFPHMPLTPTVVPFPLPSKYHLYFGEPIKFTGNPNDDDVVLEQKVNQVKSAIQAMLNQGLRERKGVFR